MADGSSPVGAASSPRVKKPGNPAGPDLKQDPEVQAWQDARPWEVAEDLPQPQGGNRLASADDLSQAGSMPARFPVSADSAKALDDIAVSAAARQTHPPFTVINDTTMKLQDILKREAAVLGNAPDRPALIRAVTRQFAATAARYSIQAQAGRAARDKAAAAWTSLGVDRDEAGNPKGPVTDPQTRAVYLAWKAAEAKVNADEAMIDRAMGELEAYDRDPAKNGNAAKEAIAYINSELAGTVVPDDLDHSGRGFPLSLANSQASLRNREDVSKTFGSTFQAWHAADAELAKAVTEPPLTFVNEGTKRLGEIIAKQAALLDSWSWHSNQDTLAAKAKKLAATAASYSIQLQADQDTRDEAREAAKILGVKLDKNETPDFSDPQERALYLKWKDAQAKVDADQAMIDRGMAGLQTLADGQRASLRARKAGAAAANGAIAEINRTLAEAGVTDGDGRPLSLSLADTEAARSNLQAASRTTDARIKAWQSANAELALARAIPERSILGIGEVSRAFSDLGDVHAGDFPERGEGPGIDFWFQRDYLRVKKAVAGGIQRFVRINDRYPGSPKVTIEVGLGTDVALRDWAVETNLYGPKRSPPSFLGEVITNGPAPGVEGRFEYTLTRAEYNDFIKNYLGREIGDKDKDKDVNNLIVAQAFESYLKVNPHDPIGYDGTFSFSVSLKEYGSITGINIADRLAPAFPRLGIPVPVLRSMAEDAIRMAPVAIGAYEEAGASLKIALTYQHYDATTFDVGAARVDDINPGARNALVLKVLVDGQSFATLSAGGTAVAGFGGEGSVLGGVAWVFDSYHRSVQTTYMGELSANKFTTEGRPAIDFRPNVPNPPIPVQGGQITGAQATFFRFPLEGGAGTFEIRVNQYKNGLPRSDRDVLIEQFTTLVENGDTDFRLGVLRGREDYRQLFSQQWEDGARQAYVKNVRGGALIADGEWGGILSDALSGKRVDSLRAARWAHDFITPERKEVYSNWPKIGREFLEDRDRELARLDPSSRAAYDKIYKYYYNVGLRTPGVYFGVYKTEGEFTKLGGGVSVGGAKLPADDGLYQANDTRKTAHMDQVASIGVRPEAWPEFNRHLHTPGVREAVLQYYNRYGQPRESAVDPNAGRNARGESVDDSVLSFLMYNGITPTRERRQLEEATQVVRDFSKEQYIYTVRAGDGNFTDIGRQALAQVTHSDPRSISGRDAKQYWDQMSYFNFKRGNPRLGTFTPGLGESNPEVFLGAHLLLPPPQI
jgi:hypothetical protein